MLIIAISDGRQQSQGNRMCKAGHNRFMTVFVYLNDCAEGGCTTFPRIGLHYGKDGTSFYDNPAPFNITGLEFVSQLAVSVCAYSPSLQSYRMSYQLFSLPRNFSRSTPLTQFCS